MSNFTRVAWHPRERVARAAHWLDNYFGPHSYGVSFPNDSHVYKPHEVEIPLDLVLGVLTQAPAGWRGNLGGNRSFKAPNSTPG